MSPFVIFVVILVVIWTLSGIATAVNKRSEQERRQRLREQMARAAGGLPTRPGVLPQAQREAQRRAQPSATRRIAAGIAQRFPQVLQPPQPAPPRRPAPPKRPPPVRVPFAQAKRTPKQQVRQAGRLTYAPAPPLPPAMPAQPARAARQPAPASPTVTKKARSANASSIARWLNPNTLRGQFILTEVFQPPLALREERKI